jgi:hypothetical protein
VNSTAVFLTQLSLSLVVFTLLARWVLAPWLAEKPLTTALMILITPHAMRHIGLSFLVPSVASPQLPQGIALAAAYGDFAAGLLALLALVALRQAWRNRLAIVWVFSVVGVVDLANALRQAEVIPLLEGTWYIPTFIVPLLLVTHVMIIGRLLLDRKGSRSNGDQPIARALS